MKSHEPAELVHGPPMPIKKKDGITRLRKDMLLVPMFSDHAADRQVRFSNCSFLVT